MHQVRPLQSEDEGVQGTPDQLLDELLDWRERVSAFVSRCNDRGQLAILAVELESALEFDLEELGRVKLKVQELGD